MLLPLGLPLIGDNFIRVPERCSWFATTPSLLSRSSKKIPQIGRGLDGI